jgi:hypothetical protein
MNFPVEVAQGRTRFRCCERGTFAILFGGGGTRLADLSTAYPVRRHSDPVPHLALERQIPRRLGEVFDFDGAPLAGFPGREKARLILLPGRRYVLLHVCVRFNTPGSAKKNDRHSHGRRSLFSARRFFKSLLLFASTSAQWGAGWTTVPLQGRLVNRLRDCSPDDGIRDRAGSRGVQTGRWGIGVRLRTRISPCRGLKPEERSVGAPAAVRVAWEGISGPLHTASHTARKFSRGRGIIRETLSEISRLGARSTPSTACERERR